MGNGKAQSKASFYCGSWLGLTNVGRCSTMYCIEEVTDDGFFH